MSYVGAVAYPAEIPDIIAVATWFCLGVTVCVDVQCYAGMHLASLHLASIDQNGSRMQDYDYSARLYRLECATIM